MCVCPGEKIHNNIESVTVLSNLVMLGCSFKIVSLKQRRDLELLKGEIWNNSRITPTVNTISIVWKRSLHFPNYFIRCHIFFSNCLINMEQIRSLFQESSLWHRHRVT